jgi:hypothetical protein
MRKNTSFVAMAASVILIGSQVVPAVAQTPSAPSTAPGLSAGPPSRICSDLDALLAGALAFGRIKLALADTQLPAWNKFGASASDAIEPVRQACATLPPSALQTGPLPPLPERLEHVERFGSAALEALRRLRPAVMELYAGLTPQQRETLDQLGPLHHP